MPSSASDLASLIRSCSTLCLSLEEATQRLSESLGDPSDQLRCALLGDVRTLVHAAGLEGVLHGVGGRHRVPSVHLVLLVEIAVEMEEKDQQLQVVGVLHFVLWPCQDGRERSYTQIRVSGARFLCVVHVAVCKVL